MDSMKSDIGYLKLMCIQLGASGVVGGDYVNCTERSQ